MNPKEMSLLNNFYQIIDLEKTGDNSLSATLEINANHAIFGGHFPGIPVVPGVCMVQMVKELLEKTLGKTARLTASRNIKFLHVINPLEHKTVALKLDYQEVPGGQFSVNSSIVSLSGGQFFFKMKGVFEM
ncbi:MAG: hypothetical protein R2830_15545 [Saprospiraceae bacterium]